MHTNNNTPLIILWINAEDGLNLKTAFIHMVLALGTT